MKLVIADLNNRGIYRPLDEIYGEYETNDTGLCNRLLCWELVKIINHIHDDKFEIVLDIQQNPETNNCFTLEVIWSISFVFETLLLYIIICLNYAKPSIISRLFI